MNFNPELSTGAAVFLSLLAAFFWGTWFISLKYLGSYPVDGFYLTLFATSLIFVWTVGIILDHEALLGNIRQVLAADPSRVTITLLCGVLYVIGIRLSLTVMQKIGLSLSQPIQASINIMVGTLVSGLVGGIPAGVSWLWIAVACMLLIAAVVVSMIAGKMRSQVVVRSGEPASDLRFTPRDLWKGLGLLVVSSGFVQAYTFGLSYGLRSISQPVGLAVLPFMALLATGAFVGALSTSGLLLSVRKQWRVVFCAPLSIHKFGILSGLAHYGGNIIHALATVSLSSVISWPLGVTMGLWTQFWGLVYGEFRGAPRRVYVVLFLGIALYLSGALIIAIQAR
jgi:hypothetical protein